MGDGFRGVSAERDGRFKLAEKKLMAKMKFPPEFVHKVDMSKVHLEVLRPWVAKKVSDKICTTKLHFPFDRIQLINIERCQLTSKKELSN
jgi:hypothetical protein